MTKPYVNLPSARFQTGNNHLRARPNNYYSDRGNTFLALLNSKVYDFVLKQITTPKWGGYFEYKPMYLWRLSIYRIDETKNRRAAQQQLRSSISDSEQRTQEQRMLILDREIDKPVFELYVPGDEEIRVVEG
jgi:hypothetical protein